jgi:hypothetical protein
LISRGLYVPGCAAGLTSIASSRASGVAIKAALSVLRMDTICRCPPMLWQMGVQTVCCMASDQAFAGLAAQLVPAQVAVLRLKFYW